MGVGVGLQTDRQRCTMGAIITSAIDNNNNNNTSEAAIDVFNHWPTKGMGSYYCHSLTL